MPLSILRTSTGLLNQEGKVPTNQDTIDQGQSYFRISCIPFATLFGKKNNFLVAANFSEACPLPSQVADRSDYHIVDKSSIDKGCKQVSSILTLTLTIEKSHSSEDEEKSGYQEPAQVKPREIKVDAIRTTKAFDKTLEKTSQNTKATWQFLQKKDHVILNTTALNDFLEDLSKNYSHKASDATVKTPLLHG